MSYQVLARKWRPKRFADLVGQSHVVRALSNALTAQRLHHAYLLTGTRGVGKTTIARILAKSLNCEQGIGAEPCGVCSACLQIDAGRFVDLLEIDAASNTGIDNIREVLDNAQYAPSVGRYKVYIIDEVHMLSKSAFNAMLKTLEEPPEHVKFILATTDPQKVPVTVLSRCLQFSLRNMTPQQVAAHLAHVLNIEGIAFEPDALALLGRAAAGSMRDALSLLDQAIAYGLGQVETEGIRSMLGAVDRRYVFTVLAALAEADGPRLMDEAAQLSARGLAADAVLTELAAVLYQVALLQTVPAAVADDEPEREALAALAQAITQEDMQLYYQIVTQGRANLALAPDEHLGLGMTFLRLLAFHPGQVIPAVPQAAPPAPAAQMPTTVGSSASGAGQASAGGAAAALARILKREIPPPPAVIARQVAEPIAVIPVPPPVVQSADDPPWEAAPVIKALEVASPVVETPLVVDASVPTEQAPDDTSVWPEFDGDWLALVEQLKPNLGGQARMLAQNAELIDYVPRRLQLRVPSAQRFVTGRDYVEKLAAVLEAHFSTPIVLNVDVGEVSGETLTMQQVRVRQEHLDVARQSLAGDATVQQLIRDFGASILPESIQPIQE